MESKEWNWKDNINDYWLDPALESYYYANKWKKNNKLDVLDLGCGLGRHSMLFYDTGLNVTACDLSDYCLDFLTKWQKERNVKFPIVKCNMLEMPFKPNSFDAVFAFHVFSHTDTEGIFKLFSDIHKILKNEGEVFFDILSKNSWIYKDSGYPKLDENTILSQDKEELNIPHICMDIELLKALLKDFSIITIREIYEAKSTGLDNGRVHYYVYARKK